MFNNSQWDKIRKSVLERDNYTCVFCGHRALKFMNIHHKNESGDNSLRNLATTCVACHAVSHIGLNLSLGIIEIWKSKLPQVEIVRRTRRGIKKGLTLKEIKKKLPLERGPYPVGSVIYANELIEKMRNSPRAYLKEPLCAVFVKLKRWQVE